MGYYRNIASFTVRGRPGRLSARSDFPSKSVSYGAFVWARRGAFVWALHRQKRRSLAPRAAACLVHSLRLQAVTSPRFTTLNSFAARAGQGVLVGGVALHLASRGAFPYLWLAEGLNSPGR